MEDEVKEIVLEISSNILKLAGFGDDLEENKKKVLENIQNGKAYEKFIELISRQGGDTNFLKDIPKAKYIEEIKSEQNGYVTKLDAEKCRKSFTWARSTEGIKKKIKLIIKQGLFWIKKLEMKWLSGETLAYIHANNKDKIEKEKKNLKEAFEISLKKPEKYKSILEIM